MLQCSPELIRLAKSENDIVKLVHDVFRGMIHQLKRTLVVWLYETVILRQSNTLQLRRYAITVSAYPRLPVKPVAI